MSENNNNQNEKNKTDIDELLRDFGRQKDAHRESFGEIEPPKRSKRQGGNSDFQSTEASQGTQKKRDKAKQKSARKKSPKDFKTAARAFFAGLAARFKSLGKKAKIVICACIAAVLAVAIAVTAVSASKTAYLRQYKKEYPDVDFPAGIRESFCEQYAGQSSTVGKIAIAGCEYSGWILSTKSIGNAALDKNCSAEEPDWITTVYLPQSANIEKAFSSSESYIKTDQGVVYSTLFNDYNYNIIGAFYVNANAKDDGGYVFPYNTAKKMTGSSFSQFSDELSHRFLYNSDYKLKYNKDKLIMLVGSSSVYPDFKFVAVGVLNGKAQVNAKANDQIQYPQAWYDKNNQSNPYRFSIGWYPTVYSDSSEKETAVLSARDY